MKEIILCFSYIILIILLGTYFLKNELGRKFIHIMLCNIWFIFMILFSHSSVIPFAISSFFIVLNIFFYKHDFIPALKNSNRGYGTIYYAISLAIISFISYNIFGDPSIGTLGILCMGYGDGFAALTPKLFSKKTYIYNNKTVVGSATMFFISLICSIIVFHFSSNSFFLTNGKIIIIKSIIIASISMLIELFSKNGSDNIFVPLITTIIYIFFK